MGAGGQLGRVAAYLVRQRRRLQETPMEPVGARVGRAAGTLVGKHLQRKGPKAGHFNTAMRSGLRHLWSHSGNALRRLGLQVSAVLFFFFAAGFGWAGYKAWMADRAHTGVPLISNLTQASSSTQIELTLALVFTYFGISSLVRAASSRHA